MILYILLGCALPAPVAYMVVALVVSPSMKDMGIPIVTTHLFCFYFSFLSNITLPIAGSAMVAARVLGISFMRTGGESFKFAMPFFVVPYFAIFNPVMAMQAQNPVDAGIAIITLISCCISISAAVWGYFRGKLQFIERLLFAISAIVCTIAGLLILQFWLLTATCAEKRRFCFPKTFQQRTRVFLCSPAPSAL